MEMANDLKELERKAFLTTFQDGIYDICFGFFILLWAVIPVLNYWGIARYYLYILMFVPSLFIWLGKRYITVPRLGMVQFGAKRKRRGFKTALFGLVMFTITVIIFLLVKNNGVQNGLVNSLGGIGLPIIEGLVIMILLWTLALFTEFHRLIYYSLAFGLGIPLAEILFPIVGEPLDAVIVFGIGALLALGYGTHRLRKFMIENPVNTEDYDDGQ